MLAILVVNNSAQQPGPQGQTHCGHFAGDWAWQDQRLLARVDQLLQLRINKAVGDHFLVAFVVKHGFHTLQGQVGFTMGTHHQTGLNGLVRDIVVAIYAGHFFHQIFFDFHVKTPGWRNGFPLVLTFGHFTAQTRQNVGHLGIGNMMTNQAIELAAAQGNGCAFRQRRFVSDIDNRTGFTAADVDQKASRSLHRFVLQRRVNATLVAVRRIGVQAMTACATGDRERAEEGAFQQDVLRFVIYPRVFATEDTAHRQRFAVVSNHQRIRVQLRFGAIKQNQGFALFCHTDNNTAFDTIFIERMHWLTQFQQNVVGDVNHRVDRANAAAAQLLFHPQWCWRFHVDAFYHAAEVSWASIRGVNLNRQYVTDGRFYRYDLRGVQFGLVQHGHVARHADDT